MHGHALVIFYRQFFSSILSALQIRQGGRVHTMCAFVFLLLEEWCIYTLIDYQIQTHAFNLSTPFVTLSSHTLAFKCSPRNTPLYHPYSRLVKLTAV